MAVAALLLALGAATALAAPGEELEGGPPNSEPVIVPEVETPSTPSVPTPVTAPSNPSSAPVSKPSESAPSSTTTQSTHTTSGSTRSSSGSGSHSSPTTVTHTVRGPSSGGSGRTESSGSSGGGGGGSTETAPVAVTPTGSSSPASVASAPTSNVEKAAADLANAAGGTKANDKKSRQKAVSDLGKALGTALLGKAAAVSHPEKKHAVLFVPLPGKSKLPYLIVILTIAAILGFILMVQFTNPQRVRYWRARLFGLPQASITVSTRTRPESPVRLEPDARPSRLRTAERGPRPRRGPSEARRKAA